MPKTVGPKRLKNDSDTNIGIPKPDQEWFRRRIKSRGLLNKDVAEAFGVHPNKVWMMIAGEKGIKPVEMLTWARILGVPVPVVWRAFGLPWPDITVPVAGLIRADGRVTPEAGERSAPAPVDDPAGLAALAVGHDVPALGLRRGAFLYYRPVDRMDVSAVGRLAVVGLGDQPAPVVGVLDATALGRVRVVVLGGAEVVESTEPISAAPVEWVRAG